MRVNPYLCALLVTAQAVTPASALDLGKANPVNWFKSKEDRVPSVSEKQSQEGAAQAILRDARTAQSTGNAGKAQSLYKDIVLRYRFTDTAAVAQFEYARLVRSEGKLQNSYDAFQKFADDYRQSPLFNDAIQQQFEIAEEARAGKKQPSLLMIPMKMDKSALVKMYKGVISNSPYGKYAPYAQFAIGEVYQDDGDKTNANAAFQSVVENYPNTKLASEAQFRVGAISSQAAAKTQDSQNLVASRDALETYKAANPTGERLGETEALLNQNTEDQSAAFLQIAKFYESQNKPKAAAIYYNEAMKFGSPEATLEARQRMAALATAHPKEMKDNLVVNDAEYTIPAAANLKSRDEYAGPPAPVVARMGRKPQMRVDDDNFKPIPLQEPELPTRASDGAPAQPGMLLPPASPSAKPPATLPVPAAPGAPEMRTPTLDPLPPPAAPVPVPPAPGEAKTSAPTDSAKPN